MDLKFGDSHEELAKRLQLVEKMLKFTSIQGDADNSRKVENKMRRDMEQFL